MCSFKEIGKEFPILFNCKITNDARKKMEKAHRIYWRSQKREVKLIQPYVSTYVPPILSREEIQHREKLELLKKIESNTYCIRTGQFYDYRV